MTTATDKPTPSATLGGLAALALWSTSIAVSRGLSESLGALTAAACTTTVGGVALLVWNWAGGHSPRRMLALPPRYLLACGGLFVAYTLVYYLAIGWASTRPAALLVALINYTWPALMVALAVPLLRQRARWFLWAGCALAIAGTALAVLVGQPGQPDLAPLQPAAILPLVLAVAAALTWALYSNLTTRLGSRAGGATPLFILASAAVLWALRALLGDPRPPAWNLKALAELAVMGLGSQAAGYALWDLGMRRGNHSFLALASYFLPVTAAAVLSAYLGIVPGPAVAAGFLLVTAGALLCRLAVIKPNTPAPPPPK